MSEEPGTGEAPRRRTALGDLIARLIGDLANLLRSELRLAQAEVKANITALLPPLLLLLLGLLLLVGALFTLLGALVAWLAPLIGAGWAAFAVAATVGGAGAWLVNRGRQQLTEADLAPPRILDTLRSAADRADGDTDDR